jgi:hypothetical protein
MKPLEDSSRTYLQVDINRVNGWSSGLGKSYKREGYLSPWINLESDENVKSFGKGIVASYRREGLLQSVVFNEIAKQGVQLKIAAELSKQVSKDDWQEIIHQEDGMRQAADASGIEPWEVAAYIGLGIKDGKAEMWGVLTETDEIHAESFQGYDLILFLDGKKIVDDVNRKLSMNE